MLNSGFDQLRHCRCERLGDHSKVQKAAEKNHYSLIGRKLKTTGILSEEHNYLRCTVRYNSGLCINLTPIRNILKLTCQAVRPMPKLHQYLSGPPD